MSPAVARALELLDQDANREGIAAGLWLNTLIEAHVMPPEVGAWWWADATEAGS